MQARLLMPAAALAALALTASPAMAKQVKLTIADTGTTVTVHRGDTLAISLAANQTTPFHWVVTQRPARAVARVTRAKYVASKHAVGMVGTGGLQQYTLKATGTGRTTFATQYQELDSGKVGSGASRFTLRVRVR